MPKADSKDGFSRLGAECMLAYAVLKVLNRITPSNISDPQQLVTCSVGLA